MGRGHHVDLSFPKELNCRLSVGEHRFILVTKTKTHAESIYISNDGYMQNSGTFLIFRR